MPIPQDTPNMTSSMQQPPMEAAQPTNQQPAQPGGGQPTPQEQQQYEKLILAGMKMLYSEQTHQGIMKMLSDGRSNPPKALADVVTLVMVQLAKKANNKIPPVIVLPAAAELLGLVAELAHTAKLFQVDERIINAALQQIVANLAGKMNPDSVKRLIESVPQDKLKDMVAQQEGYAAQPEVAAPPAAPTVQP